MPKITPMDDAECGLPTIDRSSRHTVDQLLRKYGFIIHSRPKRGHVVWVKDRKSFLQPDALATIPRMIREAWLGKGK
jgi:hypothetical protein